MNGCIVTGTAWLEPIRKGDQNNGVCCLWMEHIMKPNFIVIGAMKCATSTICAYLEDHPDVFMVAGGEPNYFSHDSNWNSGESRYLGNFCGAEGYPQVGEGSNDYSNAARYPESAARMAAFNPAMKVIYMVRHPVTRIHSDYVQRRSDSGDDYASSIDVAVQRQREIFIDQSLYWSNLSAYRKVFPDSQIFVGFMEDLSTDRDAFFQQLTAFLGLPPAIVRRIHVNSSGRKRVPVKAYSVVNALPAMGLLKKLLPKQLRTKIKALFLSRSAAEIRMSPKTLEHVLDLVADDAARLLEFCGKPSDFWDLTKG